MVKQKIKEIKEDNSTNINEQNIAKLINLKEFSKPPFIRKRYFGQWQQ